MMEVLNFSDNSIVNYQLVLLACSFKDEARSTVVVRNKSYCYEWPATSATFKIMCYLFEGENSLIITDKNDFLLKKLRIIYRPLDEKFLLKPLYVICDGDDGRFQAPPNENNYVDSACNRISLAAQMLQTFYAESLYEYCNERKTFSLPKNGALQCEVFRSKLHINEARKMTDRQLWIHFAKEITSVHRCKNFKFLAFLSCARYEVSNEGVRSWSRKDVLERMKCCMALGNGGLALIGTPCLFTWPEDLQNVVRRVSDSTPVDTSKFLDDSANRGTYCGCYSTTLGTVCHELGHIFDLVHTRDGIMGRGFDNLSDFFFRHRVSFSSDKASNSSVNFVQTWGTTDFKTAQSKNSVARYDHQMAMKYWNASSLCILKFHRWFNPWTPPYENTFIFDNNVITSKSAISSVEVHCNGCVHNYWNFNQSDQVQSFRIPTKCFEQGRRDSYVVFAVDVFGNNFKKKL